MSSEKRPDPALVEARLARTAWEDMAQSSNLKVSVVRRHFDALEAEIKRLTHEVKTTCSDALGGIAELEEEKRILQAKVENLTRELQTKDAEIRGIHRQHAAERPQW